jgi:hypothetical protein
MRKMVTARCIKRLPFSKVTRQIFHTGFQEDEKHGLRNYFINEEETSVTPYSYSQRLAQDILWKERGHDH